MDILYLIGDVSHTNHRELRYSLRSIEKHGINVDRVFVCGYCPDFLSDEVIKITHGKQKSFDNFSKNRNIYSSILYAVETTDIGIKHNGEFLISMDDHFYCMNVDFNRYPFFAKDYLNRFHRYLLPNMLDYTKSSVDYQQILVNTYHMCLNNNLNIINLTLHRNMHMNRYILREMDNLNSEILNSDKNAVEAMCVALNYRLTKYPFKYEVVIDVKTNNVDELSNLINNKQIHVFSTNDFELNSDIDNFLFSLYPHKSKYEKNDIDKPKEGGKNEMLEKTSSSN